MSQPLFNRFMDPNDTEFAGASWNYTNTNSTTDTYTLKNSAGGVWMTLTIVYTDTTKSQISTVTRS